MYFAITLVTEMVVVGVSKRVCSRSQSCHRGIQLHLQRVPVKKKTKDRAINQDEANLIPTHSSIEILTLMIEFSHKNPADPGGGYQNSIPLLKRN